MGENPAGLAGGCKSNDDAMRAGVIDDDIDALG
jgi:hypothetical protein